MNVSDYLLQIFSYKETRSLSKTVERKNKQRQTSFPQPPSIIGFPKATNPTDVERNINPVLEAYIFPTNGRPEPR